VVDDVGGGAQILFIERTDNGIALDAIERPCRLKVFSAATGVRPQLRELTDAAAR
jgi:hypothetical protein